MRSRRLALALTLLALHTALVGFVYDAVATSDDGKAPIVWILFADLDFPISSLVFDWADSSGEIAVALLVLGGLQWALVGYIVQRALEAGWRAARARRAPGPPA